jgi:hypothetical protein
MDVRGVGVLVLPDGLVRPKQPHRGLQAVGGAHDAPLIVGHLAFDIAPTDLVAPPLLDTPGLQPRLKLLTEGEEGQPILWAGLLD